MLKEIHKTRQVAGLGPRRWFSDSALDLFVWEDSAGRIDGFQLCYGKGRNEHAFTWKRSTGCMHHKVDDGENPDLEHKSSPILVPDGSVDTQAVLEDFRARSSAIEPNLSDFVCLKLTEWRAGHQDD